MSSLNLKPVELQIKDNEKALCLSPHADDETIGMAGVLSFYYKNFDVILLTDGRKGIKDTPTEEVIKIREEEFSNAMKIAQIENYSFLRAQDKHLIESYDKFKKIDISSYDYIFIPNIIDQHPDHKAVSLLLDKLSEERPYKKNLKICFYEVWAALALTNSYIDISDIIDKKDKCLPVTNLKLQQKTMNIIL